MVRRIHLPWLGRSRGGHCHRSRTRRPAGPRPRPPTRGSRRTTAARRCGSRTPPAHTSDHSVTIAPGGTVEFAYPTGNGTLAARHRVRQRRGRQCTPPLPRVRARRRRGRARAGSTRPGTYDFYCSIHREMRRHGDRPVRRDPTATPTPAADGRRRPPAPTATASPRHASPTATATASPSPTATPASGGASIEAHDNFWEDASGATRRTTASRSRPVSRSGSATRAAAARTTSSSTRRSQPTCTQTAGT